MLIFGVVWNIWGNEWSPGKQAALKFIVKLKIIGVHLNHMIKFKVDGGRQVLLFFRIS